MSRHNVFVSLSRPQAEYLLDVIGHDISETGLDPDEVLTAEGAQRKIARALDRVNARVKCGPDCKCRRHDETEDDRWPDHAEWHEVTTTTPAETTEAGQ